MGSAAPSQLAPVVALYHGAGPRLHLNDPTCAGHKNSLETRARTALNLDAASAPRAIVLLTAHWETAPELRISTGANPDLLYDYEGFPPEAYEITYNAPGEPEVAVWVASALRGAGLEVAEDAERGFDHGVFVPMKLVDPAEQVPIVQLSIPHPRDGRGADPAHLFAIGTALAPLRERGIALVGSGSPSFHNLDAFWSGRVKNAEYQDKVRGWQSELNAAVETEVKARRLEKLAGWKSWTGARDAHTEGKEGHFAPLLVCAAAAGDEKAVRWADDQWGIEMSTWYWK